MQGAIVELRLNNVIGTLVRKHLTPDLKTTRVTPAIFT